MVRVRKLPIEKKPPFTIHTISLRPEEVSALQQFSQGASDFLGRSISNSAVIRALVRYVSRQGPPAADALFLEVEKELKDGVMWESKKE